LSNPNAAGGMPSPQTFGLGNLALSTKSTFKPCLAKIEAADKPNGA